MNIKLFSTTPSCAHISPAVLVNFFIAALKKKKTGVKNQILLLIVTAPLNLSLSFFFLAMCAILFPLPRIESSPLQ